MNENSPHLGALEMQELLETGASAEVVEHLAECTECRIRAARLAQSPGFPGPSPSAVSRIIAAKARPTAGVIAAVSPPAEAASPSAGELWRIGDGEAMLVWVRKVFDGAADVIPVVMDVELADDQTILLPTEASTLNTELGIVTSIRGHVDPAVFISRIGDLGEAVERQVAELIAAAREGRQPLDVRVGAPVFDPDDQRIDYQQALAESLASFGPAAWSARRSFADDATESADLLYRYIGEELAWRTACRVHPIRTVAAFSPNGTLLRAVARVAYADTCVIVVIHPSWQSEPHEDLARACRLIVQQEPGAVAVAICNPEDDRPTTIVDIAAMRDAYESPGGQLRMAHASMEGMPIIDALAKYLDRNAPAWEAIEPVHLSSTDLSAAALRLAQGAVAELSRQGSRATTPAKKSAWTNMPEATAETIASTIDRILAGEPAGTALDQLLAEDSSD